MTTDQLKNFITVAEVLNFHRASENLYIAQPALSRQIKNLELEIGSILFDRTKKKIRLTAAGAFFKTEAKRILENLEQAKRRARQIQKGEAGEIKIGHASTAVQYIVPPFLRKVKTAYPDLKIGLTENTCPGIFEKLINKEIDFGILPNAIAPDALEEISIYQENFVVVAPKSMKINIKGPQVLKQLSKADWILMSKEDGLDLNEVLYRLFQKNGFLPKVIFESPNASTNLRLVSEGLGVTIVAKSALNNLTLNIKHKELHDAHTKIDMRFVWLKERKDELDGYISLFLKLFSEVQREIKK